MRFVDLDFTLLKHFGANEEVSSGRITSPYNSRSTVNLNAEMTIGEEPIKGRQILHQDGIFGVFDVFVLHGPIISTNGGATPRVTVPQANTKPLEKS